MSDSFDLEGRFYAVCTTNPPMVMLGTIARSEDNVKCRYISKSLGMEIDAVFELFNHKKELFRRIWETEAETSRLRICRFDAPNLEAA